MRPLQVDYDEGEVEYVDETQASDLKKLAAAVAAEIAFSAVHDAVTAAGRLKKNKGWFLNKLLAQRRSSITGFEQWPVLRLQVVSARKLGRADERVGESHPYCKIYYEGKLCGRTTKNKGLNPIWRDEQDFFLPLTEIDLSEVKQAAEAEAFVATQGGGQARADARGAGSSDGAAAGEHHV